MLGRTAQNLFWLSRYVERAENVARMLEVGYRMSLTSRREGGASEHLVSMLQAAEVDEEFNLKHKVADVASVSHFMLFHESNPSSVRSCLLAARTNARSVRTALTTDMWESLNSAWLEFDEIAPRETPGSRLQELLQWVKQVRRRHRGAHPRHGVLRAAAAHRSHRRRRRHPAMDSHSTGRVGASQLPPRLSRPLQGVEHRRLPDPQAADAALADLFGRLDQPQPRHARGHLWRQGNGPRRGGRRHGDARRQLDGSHLRLRAARVPHRIHQQELQDHRG